MGTLANQFEEQALVDHEAFRLFLEDRVTWRGLQARVWELPGEIPAGPFHHPTSAVALLDVDREAPGENDVEPGEARIPLKEAFADPVAFERALSGQPPELRSGRVREETRAGQTGDDAGR